jgi:hypothetical protein
MANRSPMSGMSEARLDTRVVRSSRILGRLRGSRTILARLQWTRQRRRSVMSSLV